MKTYNGINLVTDNQINKFVKKVYPEWKWTWTTVDKAGWPQILLYKLDKKKQYKEWKLIQQSNIK